jgi:hypothetical protein
MLQDLGFQSSLDVEAWPRREEFLGGAFFKGVEAGRISAP